MINCFVLFNVCNRNESNSSLLSSCQINLIFIGKIYKLIEKAYCLELLFQINSNFNYLVVYGKRLEECCLIVGNIDCMVFDLGFMQLIEFKERINHLLWCVILNFC